MADELRADPIALVRLAGEIHDVADINTDVVTTTAPALRLPKGAFGDVEGAEDLRQACTDAATTGGTTTGLLLTIMEGDVDRLYQTAFAYHIANKAIEDRAKRLGK